MRAIGLFRYVLVLIASAGICHAQSAPLACNTGETATYVGNQWMCCGTLPALPGDPLIPYCSNRSSTLRYSKECSESTLGSLHVYVYWSGAPSLCTGNSCNGQVSLDYYPYIYAELRLIRCEVVGTSKALGGGVHPIYDWKRLCTRESLTTRSCTSKPQICEYCSNGTVSTRTAYPPAVAPPVVTIIKNECSNYAADPAVKSLLDSAFLMPESATTVGGAYAPMLGSAQMLACSKTPTPMPAPPKPMPPFMH